MYQKVGQVDLVGIFAGDPVFRFLKNFRVSFAEIIFLRFNLDFGTLHAIAVGTMAREFRECSEASRSQVICNSGVH